MDISVRRLGEGDEAVVCDVARSFKNAVIGTELAASILVNPANYLVVAEADREIAGFLLAYRLDRIDRPTGQLFIYDVAVDPGHQRRGVGKALMGFATAVVESEGLMEAFVFTNRDNAAAVALYQRTGAHAEDGDGMVFVYQGNAAPPVPAARASLQ